MLMCSIEGARWAPAYPELAGKRVLITGLSSSCGVDIARAFADHKARLILQFDEMSERTQAIAEIVAPTALDIKAFGPVACQADAVAQLARAVMQAFGGLDAVINLVPLAPAELGTAASVDEIERRIGGAQPRGRARGRGAGVVSGLRTRQGPFRSRVRGGASSVALCVSGAERVFDELDDQALRPLAVERLRPSPAQGQHLRERLVA